MYLSNPERVCYSGLQNSIVCLHSLQATSLHKSSGATLLGQCGDHATHCQEGVCRERATEPVELSQHR
ncbi:hypothetical protein ABTF25_19745, partial [Acinetobacter baumannii]